MGAIIMNGAIIGKGSVVGAGAVIKENMVIPDLKLVVGIPGKIVKTLPETTFHENVKWAKKYVKLLVQNLQSKVITIINLLIIFCNMVHL